VCMSSVTQLTVTRNITSLWNCVIRHIKAVSVIHWLSVSAKDLEPISSRFAQYLQMRFWKVLLLSSASLCNYLPFHLYQYHKY